MPPLDYGRKQYLWKNIFFPLNWVLNNVLIEVTTVYHLTKTIKDVVKKIQVNKIYSKNIYFIWDQILKKRKD